MNRSDLDRNAATRYADFFVPAFIGETSELLYRARIVVLTLLIIALASTGVFFTLLFIPALASVRDFALPVSFSTFAGAFYLLYRMKYRGSYTLCVVGALTQLIVTIVAILIITGGPSVSSMGQLLGVPCLMAFFFGGLRWGVRTTLLTAIIIAVLLLLSASGYQYPNLLTLAFSPQYLVMLDNFVMLSALALAYESASLALRRERDREHQDVLLLAKTDPLTGLANRRVFEETLRDRIQLYASLTPPRAFTLCYLDLNRFKPINDSHGHGVGDDVLNVVSRRLRGALHGADFIGRQGGDEFMIILDQVNDVTAVDALAKRFGRIIDEPINTSVGPLTVGASLGFALFPVHGATGMDLLKAADTAMYYAKRNELQYAIFEASPTTEI